LSSTFVALEIGTWFGEGSTSIWAKHLKKGSQLFLIDNWAEYISDADKATDSAYSAMDSVHHIAINSTLKKVYGYQEMSGGEIFVLRGKASRLCRFFQPGTFDFIYIDGSHYYEEVQEDIRLAKSLIKDGGIICGDDLEVEPTAARMELARRNVHRDFIKSEEDNLSFHPGVLLAVYEHFPAVTNNAGIWAVEKRGGDWIAA
jgi:predicted O-methyltransferase YrrM